MVPVVRLVQAEVCVVPSEVGCECFFFAHGFLADVERGIGPRSCLNQLLSKYCSVRFQSCLLILKSVVGAVTRRIPEPGRPLTRFS